MVYHWSKIAVCSIQCLILLLVLFINVFGCYNLIYSFFCLNFFATLRPYLLIQTSDLGYIKATDRDIFIYLPEKLCLLTIKVMSNYLMECSTYMKRALMTFPLFLNICARVWKSTLNTPQHVKLYLEGIISYPIRSTTVVWNHTLTV